MFTSQVFYFPRNFPFLLGKRGAVPQFPLVPSELQVLEAKRISSLPGRDTFYGTFWLLV